MEDLSGRTFWRGFYLNYTRDEPLLKSLFWYRLSSDRVPVSRFEANLVSSKTRKGFHKPIIDLDFDHEYVQSTNDGHGHLYLNVEIPWWRWAILMIALRLAGAVELGYTAWSLRRGANFVRPPWVVKTPAEELRTETPPKFGWLFKYKPDTPIEARIWNDPS